jgi:hypothetical protein
MNIEWSVCIYRGERFDREVVIDGLPVEELRKILNRPADDPLVDCYPIGAPELATLAPYCRGEIPRSLGPNEWAFVEASQA